ncbi:CoA-binding protein [Lutimonas vermicola]|uniref:CoA-binding protein n=1 Tax=Lutimonas vermicola TaxID=414288 RepID=A0ABU9KW35_9FLAO
MKIRKVLVLGASLKQDRYSNRAIRKLAANNFWVVGLGLREGDVSGIKIHTEQFDIEDLYAVTIYMNAYNQEEFYDYLVGLKPQKIIFNPGAENSEFESVLKNQGIPFERACTLVLLSMDQF